MSRVWLPIGPEPVWPPACCCCQGAATTTAAIHFRLPDCQATWHVPYCERCLDHVRLAGELADARADLRDQASRRGARLRDGVVFLVLGVLALPGTAVAWLLDGLDPAVLVGGAAVAVGLIVAGTYRTVGAAGEDGQADQARDLEDRLQRRLTDRCACSGPAVRTGRLRDGCVALEVDSADWAAWLGRLNP